MSQYISPQNWILFSIPILFFIGSFMHFIYQLSGKKIIVALFSPINESIWEHSKLSVFPILICWICYAILFPDSLANSLSIWLTGCLTSLISSIFIMLSLFYFYTQAFGIESLWIDIFIFFLSILFSQLLGLHIYQYATGLPVTVCILCFIIIIGIYFLFTFSPPKLPLFRDGPTGKFGI